MKIYLHTLGCKVNQFESQAMEELLRRRGHVVADEPEGCDIVIINSCAVTAESSRKSRQAVRRLRSLAPDAVVGVCGCWPQSDAEGAGELADVVFGSSGHERFLDALENAYLTRESSVSVDDALKRRSFERLPAGNPSSRTRALLKIEDGCVNFCSYCIIPFTRGPVRSLPIDEIASEASRLKREGIREIVLTGIEIASYGRDLGGLTLADAAEAAANAAEGVRIRLGSLEPRVITEETCRKLAALPGLCPHFHLSLQSGCDATLKRMNRKYDTARFYESVALLRSYFKDPGMTADVICGFPGETEEEFSETLAFLTKCAFSQTHIFPYSPRPGTKAASLPDAVPNSVKHERAGRAAEVAGASRDAFLRSRVGTLETVLFESERTPGIWEGHTGNYLAVRAEGRDMHNRLANVQITAVTDGLLSGVILL